MKLFGGSKNSKHTADHIHHGEDLDASQRTEWWNYTPKGQEPSSHAPRQEESARRRYEEDADLDRDAGEYEDGYDGGIPTWAKVVIIVGSVLIILFAALFIWIKTARPPEQTQFMNTYQTQSQETSAAAPTAPPETQAPSEQTESAGGETETEPPKTGRNENIYTFLVAGKDKVGSNTDVIMVANLDVENHTLNVVSIPRDTYANTTYRNHRINSIYGVGGADGLMDAVSAFMSCRPDFYAVVDLNAFIKLVDGIGGVDYYVPANINYDDEAQNLHIHFSKGMNHMTGQKAMEYCRFRSGYADADIGRIDAQHDFLMTAAKQILAKKSSIPVNTLISIVLSDVKTDLDLTSCTWLAQELLKLDAENIHFFTLPGNYNDVVNGSGYVTVKIDEWVEMLNESFNPFYEEITTANIDVAGRNANGKMVATSGTLK